MVNMIITAVLFSLYCLKTKKTKGTWACPSMFLILLYLFSLCCGLLHIYLEKETMIGYTDYMPYSLLLVFLMLLYFNGFVSLDEVSATKMVLPSRKWLDRMSTIVIVLSFIAILFFADGVTKVFSMEDLGAARNNRYIYGDTYVETGLLYTVCSVASSLYVFALLLFFIYLVIGGNKIRCVMLFISSFSEVLHVLSEVGRDGIVFWLFSFIFFYLLFKDFMKKKQVKFISKVFIIFTALALIPFMMISAGRFTENLMGELVSYMGQQFKHFCYYFDLDPRPMAFGRGFPLVYEILGEELPEPAIYSNDYTDSSAFGFFFLSFFINFGVTGTIIIGFILTVLQRCILKIKNNHLRFNTLFIYILFFQIFSQGVFYFRHYTRGGNLFIVLCFVLYFITRGLSNSRESIIITKKND